MRCQKHVEGSIREYHARSAYHALRSHRMTHASTSILSSDANSAGAKNSRLLASAELVNLSTFSFLDARLARSTASLSVSEFSTLPLSICLYLISCLSASLSPLNPPLYLLRTSTCPLRNHSILPLISPSTPATRLRLKCDPQRSWDEALGKSKDASTSLVRDRETRLENATRELEETREELREARRSAAATAAALRQEREALATSRARTDELHKLGVDMERELTAMLEGGWTSRSIRFDSV